MKPEDAKSLCEQLADMTVDELVIARKIISSVIREKELQQDLQEAQERNTAFFKKLTGEEGVV